VRYSLANSTAPLAVASYTYDALPSAVRDALPTDAEITTALGAATDGQDDLKASLGTDDES